MFRLAGLEVETLALRGLDEALRRELFDFAIRYTTMDEQGFEASLLGKRDLVLFRSPETGEIAGCGTVGIDRIDHADTPRLVFFVGDTVFRPEIRGQALAQRVGARYWWRERLRSPGVEIWAAGGMMTISSYLMHARFFARHHPGHASPLDENLRTFLLEIGRRHYGDAWLNDEGNVLAQATKRPEPGVGEVPEHLREHPDVQFYLRNNPRWREGQVLLHVVPLELSNWLSAGRSIVRKQLRRTVLRPAR